MNSFHVRLGTFNLFDETLLYLVATGFGWFFLVGRGFRLGRAERAGCCEDKMNKRDRDFSGMKMKGVGIGIGKDWNGSEGIGIVMKGHLNHISIEMY